MPRAIVEEIFIRLVADVVDPGGAAYFVDLAQRITANRAAIDATLECGLSNALIESTNTKIRLLTRVAFGFHGPEPVIGLALLALGHQPPRLPGRNHPRK